MLGRVVAGGACLAMGACLAITGVVGAQSRAPAASGASTASGPSPSDAATQCPLDDREDGPPGTPGLGTVQTPLAQGRLLMTVGTCRTPWHLRDRRDRSDGIHEIDTTAHWTINGATWESADTAIFDSEQAGPRHLFRLHLGDGASSSSRPTRRSPRGTHRSPRMGGSSTSSRAVSPGSPSVSM